jgi:hypothetical protein
LSKPEYREIQAGGVDLSESSLEQAAINADLPVIYTLVVGRQLRSIAAEMLRNIQGLRPPNRSPVIPYIDLQVDADLGAHEWYLVTPLGNHGSKGC